MFKPTARAGCTSQLYWPAVLAGCTSRTREPAALAGCTSELREPTVRAGCTNRPRESAARAGCTGRPHKPAAGAKRTDIRESPRSRYCRSLYPVLNIHHTNTRQAIRKPVIMVMLRPTLTSATSKKLHRNPLIR